MRAMRTFLRCCALGAMIGLLAPSQAQEPPRTVAQLKEVHGNVLVSRESGLASGDEGVRLSPGTRVITTAHADAIVAYDNGCEVRLKENQRFEVQEDKPCAALIAQASSILAEPAGAALATSATGAAVFAATLPPLSGALVGLGILQDVREKQVVSPN
jgi:hypothetical protein